MLQPVSTAGTRLTARVVEISVSEKASPGERLHAYLVSWLVCMILIGNRSARSDRLHRQTGKQLYLKYSESSSCERALQRQNTSTSTSPAIEPFRLHEFRITLPSPVMDGRESLPGGSMP